MTHIARGLDRSGSLELDIILSGRVPRFPDRAQIILLPYVEDYIQTDAGESRQLIVHTFIMLGATGIVL